MSNVYDGGPAFPVLNRSKECSNWDGETHVAHETVGGMSLRAYFMAHAPAEPQPWFSPTIPALQAPSYPPPLKNLTQEERDDLDGWRDGFRSTDDITSQNVREHVLAVNAYNQAAAARGHEMERQRYLQWPAAWADAQLAILRGQP